MTEDEAKTKWCPQLRLGVTGLGASVNSEKTDNRCIASQCMMWRWKKTFVEAQNSQKESEFTLNNYESLQASRKKGGVLPPLPPKTVYEVMSKAENNKPTGYCGLAGQP